MYGKHHSEETKQKMSEAQKGRPKSKILCPHCYKEGAYNKIKRWYFDNCKNKK